MLYLAKSDFDNNLFPLLSPGQIPSAVPALHRIVIDPGHGGQDTGTTSEQFKTNEKTNTLDTGLRLAEELRKRGYEVILTRTKDVYVELPERTAIANRAKADLYISIHFNHAEQDYVSGIETWILPPPGQPFTNETRLTESDKRALPGNRFDAWNAIAGFSLERAVARELDAGNRGLKREHLKVLDNLNMPGLLIECGFLSNPAEGRKIVSPDYHQKIATAIADGVDLYKSTLDHLRPKPLTSPTAPASTAAKK
jgi:N-acetylmuramoyl-L-alanine amidase